MRRSVTATCPRDKTRDSVFDQEVATPLLDRMPFCNILGAETLMTR